MNYYKLWVSDGTAGGRSCYGSSPDSLESLSEKASRGEFIRLDDMFYSDRGEIKDWSQWDDRELPTILVKGSAIITIQQFKADPRTLKK